MGTKVTLIIVALLLICGGVIYAHNMKKDNKKDTVVFDVSMTCENCKKRIEKNIAYEKGVTDMKVDLPAKTVEVEYRKDKTSVDKLQKAFEKLGYNATLHTEQIKDQKE